MRVEHAVLDDEGVIDVAESMSAVAAHALGHRIVEQQAYVPRAREIRDVGLVQPRRHPAVGARHHGVELAAFEEARSDAPSIARSIDTPSGGAKPVCPP